MSQIGALISGLWGDAGQNFVNEQGGNAAVFGTKPKVAPFEPTNLAKATEEATAGNLANFDLVTSYLEKIAPGISDIIGLGLKNTASELQGQLPQDVQDEVYRNSAFKSLMGGFGGTPMAKALTARDLGLTSLNLTQLGTNSAQQWAQLAEQAYSPFTVSTSQQAAVTAANLAGKQATKQLGYNIEAAPDPGALGVFNVDAALGQQMLSLGGGILGGLFGGGGGTPSAQAPAGGYGYGGYDQAGHSLGGNYAAGSYSYNPGMGYSYTPSPQGAWGYSDRKLKRDFWLLGESETGIKVYSFEYDKPEGQAAIRFLGVMADEIQEICPGAVIEIDGYLAVDYDQIDVKLQEVKNAWVH